MAVLPIGSIINYYGSLGAIPPGWALYAPLTDRSVLGAGGASAVGDVGGTLTPSYPGHAHGKGDLINTLYPLLSPAFGQSVNAHGHIYDYAFGSSPDSTVDVTNGILSHDFFAVSVHGHSGTDDTSVTGAEMEWFNNSNYHTHPVTGETDAAGAIGSSYVAPMTGLYWIIRLS